MTNNYLADEQLENTIEMAEDAAKRYGAEWNSALVAGVGGNFHAITSDTIQAVVVQANDDSRDASWLCDYLESVSPGLVLSLLRELQQYRKAESADREMLKRLAVILSGSDAPGEIRALTVTAQSLVDRCKTLARERDALREKI